MENLKLNSIVSLCKRRGFVFPSSEIYGGLNSCWDYGPLGVQLKLNIKKGWWDHMTHRSDIVGLDSSIFMHPKVWEASGHLENFTDDLCDCKDCKFRFRKESDQVECPKCKSKNCTEPRQFNLLFKTFMGPLEDDKSVVYLRPETAQGIYVNFQNVHQSLRKPIPFGIAQIGKAFRNEITPSHFIFRMREFEQMEMQYFIPPEQGDKWFDYWKTRRKANLLSLGLEEKHLHFKEHSSDELAHYAKKALDIEYDFPMGKRELEGLHHRGDYDLQQHQKFSGKKLLYFDAEQNKSYLPHVIETSIGCDRLLLALLCSAYREEEVKGEKRVFLKLKPHIAPIQIAVLPLSKKTPLIDMGHKIQQILQETWFIEYDISGSIGKRYRRQDEIGTPWCLTIDFESLEDQKVTVRDRDTMKQTRISIDSLETYFKDSNK
ncbi:MAG: glycine--tRNA ligase [Bdellovibrionales bacterium]